MGARGGGGGDKMGHKSVKGPGATPTVGEMLAVRNHASIARVSKHAKAKQPKKPK